MSLAPCSHLGTTSRLKASPARRLSWETLGGRHLLELTLQVSIRMGRMVHFGLRLHVATV